MKVFDLSFGGLVFLGTLGVLPAMQTRADETLGGVTYHTTDPGDATHGTPVEIDDSALTFDAWFDSGNESNATVSGDVLSFLASQGTSGIVYLGRNDGSGDLSGTSVSTVSSDGGLSGAWTFNPGLTGKEADFLLIHGGGGTINYLYAINHPGLTGVWDTSEALVGPGNQSALSFLDLYGADLNILGNGGLITEPASAGLLAVGIVAIGLLGRWRPARGRRIVWIG